MATLATSEPPLEGATESARCPRPVTGGWAVALVATLAALTFVPSRYAYPTQPGRGNRLLLALSVPWALVLLAALASDWGGGPPRELVRASLLYPVLYLASAWSLSLWRTARAPHPGTGR